MMALSPRPRVFAYTQASGCPLEALERYPRGQGFARCRFLLHSCLHFGSEQFDKKDFETGNNKSMKPSLSPVSLSAMSPHPCIALMLS